jgi:hypothetical protein
MEGSADPPRQRDAALERLDSLIRRGRALRGVMTDDTLGVWQRDCSALVHQLSGGSKAHWLSRAYSAALLVRSDAGAVPEADPLDIVDRVVDVLERGRASLAGLDGSAVAPPTPRPRVFEFVRTAALRPILEQAFDDSRAALVHGDFARSLILSCSVIDTLLADALEHRAGVVPGSRGGESRGSPKPDGLLAVDDQSFEARIAAAERTGLIRGGCARLPPAARRYRDFSDDDGELRPGARVSEREARLAGQVLRVVMRDLDPGR